VARAVRRSSVRISEFRHSRIRQRRADNAVVERNEIMSPSGAVYLSNNDRLEHNRLYANFDVVVIVRGNGNALIDNVIDGARGEYTSAVNLTGNCNVLLRNTVLVHMLGGAVLHVDGTANTLDANVVPPGGDSSASYGIRFRQAGNFYGNNRISAATPYDLGGVPQTDWGGNISY